MDRCHLLNLIEELRSDLVKLFSARRDLSDPEILQKSSELDRALNLLEQSWPEADRGTNFFSNHDARNSAP